MSTAQSIGITQEDTVQVMFAPLYRHGSKYLQSNRVFVFLSRSDVGNAAEYSIKCHMAVHKQHLHIQQKVAIAIALLSLACAVQSMNLSYSSELAIPGCQAYSGCLLAATHMSLCRPIAGSRFAHTNGKQLLTNSTNTGFRSGMASGLCLSRPERITLLATCTRPVYAYKNTSCKLLTMPDTHGYVQPADFSSVTFSFHSKHATQSKGISVGFGGYITSMPSGSCCS